MQTLVNPVNCIGVMGAGLAKKFKEKHPDMFSFYKETCRKKEMKIGFPIIFKSSEKQILLFPTKNHWMDKSNIKSIQLGLQNLVDNIENFGISSIAFSALGCGLGGLKWKDIKPLLINYSNMMKIPVEIFSPY